jgi:hypothetical protein
VKLQDKVLIAVFCYYWCPFDVMQHGCHVALSHCTMHANEYWPFDIAVAILFAVLAIFTALRAKRKLHVIINERRTLQSHLKQVIPAARPAPPPAQQDPGQPSGLHANYTGAPRQGALYNHSFATQHQSFSEHTGRFDATHASMLNPVVFQELGLEPVLPPIYKDRRFSTFALLVLVSCYCVARTIVLCLGSFNVVPMDGSLECHFYTTFPAMLLMALQTALIARWARHVSETEMKLYARDFRPGHYAVYVSATLDTIVILATVFALVDTSVHKTGVAPRQWNMILSGCAGIVYALNGLIFILLGLRLFWMWQMARDPLKYEAAVDQSAMPDAAKWTDYGLAQTTTSTRQSMTSGCTKNGARGNRILIVAFGFGLVCFLRGVGLLAFVLQNYNSIDKLTHSSAAPAGALLFEFVGLAITLRLMMPPGTNEGDRDLDAKSSDQLYYSSNTVLSNDVSRPLLRATSASIASTGDDLDASARAPTRAVAIDSAKPRHGRRETAPHAPHGRMAAKSAWADAHALEGIDDRSPNPSWKVTETSDATFHDFDQDVSGRLAAQEE